MSAAIGDPIPPEDAQRRCCGLVSTLPEQFGEKCVRDATLHLLVMHPEHGTRHQLLTCADHYLIAAEAGELVADHPVGPGCSVPGACFDATAEALPELVDTSAEWCLLAVRAQQAAIDNHVAVIAHGIASGDLAETVQVVYGDLVGPLREDPEEYTAVLLLALLLLAESDGDTT